MQLSNIVIVIADMYANIIDPNVILRKLRIRVQFNTTQDTHRFDSLMCSMYVFRDCD